MPSESRPLDACFSRSARIAATRLLHPCRVDVGDHEGHLEAAQEQGGELRRHQAGSDDADLLDPARLRVRDPHTSLDPPLDQVEGVDPGLRLRAREEVGERVLFEDVAFLDGGGCRGGDQVERAVGRERDAVDGVVDRVAGLRADLGRVGEVGGLARRAPLLDRADEPRDRVVEELDVVEERVGEAELGRLVGAEHPVLLQRVRDDELDGRLRADDTGQKLRAAPGGDDPEEYLREADVAHRAGEGAEVAVQGDLEAAAEGGAVDRGERGEGQLADRREGVVASLAARPGELRRRRQVELAQVGADGEDERLAGEDEALPVAFAQTREEVVQRLEGGAAEDVRLLPVLAVVHRHEGDRPDSRCDLLQEELCRAVSHAGCSPTRSPRPCRGRCRAR